MKTYRFSLQAFVIFNFLIFVQYPSYPQGGTSVPTPSDSSAADISDSLSSARKSNTSLWKIKADDTDELIAEDVVDYVKILPNAFSLDLGSLGQFSPLVFRGLTPQEGVILIDDFIVEDPINGFLNSNIFPINFVEDITYRGAGVFAPLGAQALGGIFQVNTYHFQGKQPYSKVILRAGDFGYSDIGAIFGLPVTKSISFLIGGNRQEFDGFTFDADHEGSRIHAEILYHPNENFSLRYSAFSNKDKVEIPAPLLPDLVPPTSNGKRKENRSDHTFSLKLGNLLQNNNQSQGKIFISRLLQETLGDSLLFKNRTISFGIGLQHDLIAGNHWLSFGGELKLHDLNSARLGDRWDGIGHVFVRDVYRFVKNLALGIQARLEKHDDYSIALQPSGQLSYEVSPLSTLWFGVQRVRRYPSFAERYWPTQAFRGNPNLTEEKGTAFEIGFRLNKENHFKLETALFRHRVEDWIGLTILGDSIAFGPLNLGSRTIHGLDFKFVWNYLPGGEFGFIGSILQMEEDAPEKQLQAPEFSVYSYLEMGHRFFQDFVYVTLRLIGRFFGKRHGLLYNTQDAILPQITTLGETALLDGKLTFHFTDAAISLSMENLFDKRYQLVPSFFAPPKTFRFGIEWEFLD